MHHFYAADIQEQGGSLDDVESKHCVKVLRLRPGDEMVVLDGKGHAYLAQITEVKPHVSFTIQRVIRKEDEPKMALTLAICPTKSADRMEWMLEKIVEVGVNRVCFLNAQNSERTRLNQKRVAKKVVSAMKQSGNLWLPELVFDQSFKDYVEADNADLKLMAHCREAPKEVIGNLPKAKSISILIGPEGDFTTEEIAFAERNGALPVTLGDSRLRTETAGLVACTLINYFSVN